MQDFAFWYGNTQQFLLELKARLASIKSVEQDTTQDSMDEQRAPTMYQKQRVF